MFRKVLINYKSEITGWLLKLEPIVEFNKVGVYRIHIFWLCNCLLTDFNTKVYHTWFAENYKYALSEYEKRNYKITRKKF